jgi:hypothetical protein
MAASKPKQYFYFVMISVKNKNNWAHLDRCWITSEGNFYCKKKSRSNIQTAEREYVRTSPPEDEIVDCKILTFQELK